MKNVDEVLGAKVELYLYTLLLILRRITKFTHYI